MAEYMVLKNNVIEAIYCGIAEEGSITLPANHEVRVGESLDFYNDDYTRKSDIQLMKEKLIEIPKGYIIEKDTLREMTYDEKVIAGLEQLPSNMKIVGNKLVEKTEDEKLADMTEDEKASYHRQKRDSLLNAELWKIQRHEQEKMLGIETTLSDEQYITLLQYIQALRNIPQQTYFPNTVIYPVLK